MVEQWRPPPNGATSQNGTGITSKPKWYKSSIWAVSVSSTMTVSGSMLSMFIESHWLQKQSGGKFVLFLAGSAPSTTSQSFLWKNLINSGLAALSPLCSTNPGRSGTHVASTAMIGRIAPKKPRSGSLSVDKGLWAADHSGEKIVFFGRVGLTGRVGGGTQHPHLLPARGRSISSDVKKTPAHTGIRV